MPNNSLHHYPAVGPAQSRRAAQQHRDSGQVRAYLACIVIGIVIGAALVIIVIGGMPR